MNLGAPPKIIQVQPSLTSLEPRSTPFFLLFVTLSLAPFSLLHPYPSPVNELSRLTYFNI